MALSQTNDMAEQMMFKNKLQEYAQKSGLSLPIYHNVNEGFSHAPKFRSTVLLDKTEYTSQKTFPDRKAAEQEVAKLAYESVVKKPRFEECPPIYQEPIFCKSILHEYAIKMNLGIPKYETTYAEGPRPVFISSFVLGGKTYIGEVAKSKKVAERLVARAAIHSLLVSDNGTLAQIIQSKDKLYASLRAKRDPGYEGISTPVLVQPENLSQRQSSIQAINAPLSQSSIQARNAPLSQQQSIIQATNAPLSQSSIHTANAPWSQQQASIQARNAPLPQQQSSIQATNAPLSQQQSSIQTEIVRYNPGRGRVTDPRIGARRKLENNNWEQKKKRGYNV